MPALPEGVVGAARLRALMWRRLTAIVLLGLVPIAVAVAFPNGLFDSPFPESMPAPLRTAQHHFNQSQVLTLKFRQKKYLPELKHPLSSTGVLTIAPALGVDWRVTQPFPSEWRVTSGGRVLKGPHNGATQAIANLLMGLFSADTCKLQSLFRLYWLQRGSDWWLGLKPRDPRLRRVIQSIVVAGGQAVKQVEVRETSGDRTVIQFTAHQMRPISNSLRKRFSPSGG